MPPESTGEKIAGVPSTVWHETPRPEFLIFLRPFAALCSIFFSHEQCFFHSTLRMAPDAKFAAV